MITRRNTMPLTNFTVDVTVSADSCTRTKRLVFLAHPESEEAMLETFHPEDVKDIAGEYAADLVAVLTRWLPGSQSSSR